MFYFWRRAGANVVDRASESKDACLTNILSILICYTSCTPFDITNSADPVASKDKLLDTRKASYRSTNVTGIAPVIYLALPRARGLRGTRKIRLISRAENSEFFVEVPSFVSTKDNISWVPTENFFVMQTVNII